MKTWTIESLETIKISDVEMVALAAFSISENGKSVYYKVNLPPADITNLIPYADITQEQAIKWTQDAIGQDVIGQMYQALDNLIAQSVIPTPQPAPLPWAPVEAE
ncbi:hypothetical protein UFOVP66_55 [uncultured Caudovirales phage]|uniref:DUF7936 domain-containing protein n=1 Tax=uncultured Caudovirales phage TaxID=2100421 RepID=A0A6J5KV57_9CAUD|nr:hypothetical protein UFOVP66_55 [uncultured Caudovirales phage]